MTSDSTALTTPILTTHGPIVGQVTEDAQRFYSVPFAQEPDNRGCFEFPRPLESWTETLDVSQPGHRQMGMEISTPLGAKPGQKLPVIVWIHGGSFEEGSPEIPAFYGGHFASEGVITVALKYRLGFEGWADFKGQQTPEEAGIETDGKNTYRGLEDVLAQLRWVQDNIAAFGGDPADVTLAGQSAGAGLIAYILTLPRTKDFFVRSIMMSAALPPVQLTERTKLLRKVTGGDMSLQRWVAMSPEQRSSYIPALKKGTTPTAMPFGPGPLNIDEMRNIPVLFGSTQNEFDRICDSEKLNDALFSKNTIKRFIGTQLWRGYTKKFGAPAKNLGRYHDEIMHTHNGRVAGATYTDGVIHRMVDNLQQHYAKLPNSHAWAYHVHVEPTGATPLNREGELLAKHCVDNLFFFSSIANDPERTERYIGSEPEKMQPLADQFHADILHFVKNSEAPWPEYKNDTYTRGYSMFDNGISALALPLGRAHRCYSSES